MESACTSNDKEKEPLPQNNTLQKRVQVVDAVRGFALFGMFLANLGVFTHDNIDFNDYVSTLYSQFILNNFYTMFAILFGLSFYLFMNKTTSTKVLFVKRNIILLIIGFIHMWFIWHLDILHAYALAGFLLVLFYELNLDNLRKWLLLLFLINMIFAGFLSDAIMEILPEISVLPITRSYGAETYIENLFITLGNTRNILYDTLVDIPHYLFLFVIGLYMGKAGIHKRTGEMLEKIRLTCNVSLMFVAAFYLARNLLSSYGFYATLYMGPLRDLFNLSVTFLYISLFIILYHKGYFKGLFERMSYIGKMTLTSYLSHSVIYLILFYEFNLGLYQMLPTISIPLLAVPIFWLQAEFSRYWIKNYGHGPVEKVWRFFTYLKVVIKAE